MRILHTMLRVVNLERALAFYTEVLGMKPIAATGLSRRAIYLGVCGLWR